MPLVELTGPPTVGKSSLVGAAVRLGGADARRSVLRPRRSGPAAVTRALDDANHLPGPLRAVADRMLREPDEAETEQALLAVATDWAPFLQQVLGAPGPGDGASEVERVLALMERRWLQDALRLRALLEAHRGDGRVLLLDEGLTHPYKARGAVGSTDDEALRRYAAHVPLPDVLVVLDDDTSAIVARFRARHDHASGRARWAALGPDPSDGLLVAEIERARAAVEVIASVAEARGCRVIRPNVRDASATQRARELLALLTAGEEALGEGSRR